MEFNLTTCHVPTLFDFLMIKIKIDEAKDKFCEKISSHLMLYHHYNDSTL